MNLLHNLLFFFTISLLCALHSHIGSSFSANLTLNRLSCFGNRDYPAPTYIETLYCMLPFFYGTRHFCKSIWGSRSVLIEIIGSVEILKVLRLPSDELSWVEGNSAYAVSAANPDGLLQQQYMTINATRWLEISSVDHQFNYYYQHHSDIACDADQLSMGLCNQDSTYGGLYPPTAASDIYREVLHISAEPIYLCARSNDWRGRDSFFRIQFRHAYLRERDKQRCNEQTVLHLVLILLSTSVWLLPYLIALIAAVLSYSNGMKIMFSVFVFSACVVCLTPLMLLKSNRYRTRMYFNYFFTRSQAEESRKVIKQRIPLFQAFFFSSVVICVGFSTSYVIYHYTDMDREWRDIMFQVSHASIYSVYPPLISTSAAVDHQRRGVVVRVLSLSVLRALPAGLGVDRYVRRPRTHPRPAPEPAVPRGSDRVGDGDEQAAKTPSGALRLLVG